MIEFKISLKDSDRLLNHVTVFFIQIKNDMIMSQIDPNR